MKISVSERLKSLRIERGITWSTVARHLRLAESTIYMVLRGDRKLSDKALHRLALLEKEHVEIGSDSEIVQSLAALVLWADRYMETGVMPMYDAPGRAKRALQAMKRTLG